jgi:pseudoazurin
MIRIGNFRFGCAAVALAFVATPMAHAEEHVIKAAATKFSPLYIFVQPGDTVVWTNMVGHDSQAEQGLIPDGAEPWHLRMGDNGSVTLDVEGVYLYKCTPHFALGMAGAIIVGQPTNMADVKQNAKGMYKRVVAKLLKADWPANLQLTSN